VDLVVVLEAVLPLGAVLLEVFMVLLLALEAAAPLLKALSSAAAILAGAEVGAGESTSDPVVAPAEEVVVEVEALLVASAILGGPAVAASLNP
jgi:hypothetical protein